MKKKKLSLVSYILITNYTTLAVFLKQP